MKMQKVESSQIEAIGHDEQLDILTVAYKNRDPQKPAMAYEYKDVPKEVHAAFMASESKGKFCNEKIKPCFFYRKAGDEKWTCLKDVKFKGGCANCRIECAMRPTDKNGLSNI
jgi:hypothetical protein